MTWTVVRVAPSAFELQAPYAVAIVELEEGVRVTAQIADARPDELDFDTPVRRVLRKLRAEDDGGIIEYGYKFVLARR